VQQLCIEMSKGPRQEIDMKAKRSLTMLFVCMLLVLAIAVGCAKKNNDAQVIGEVATKIQSDAGIQTKTIAVQSTDGVVTLSGTVGSDAERMAAANDAGQVQGVRTVINNLTVATAAAQAMAPTQPEPAPAEPLQQGKSSARHNASHVTPGSRGSRTAQDTVTSSAPTQSTNTTAMNSTPPPPPAPPKPTKVTIPDGTQISVRLIDPLSSETNQVGDHFKATLNHSILVNGEVAIPAGADVEGRVTDAKAATHFSGGSALAVELTNVAMGGKSYEMRTQEYRKQGTARGKNTAEKVGGGAAVGAIIGAIAGGGKGAAIGATVGGAAGGGAQAVTRGEKINLPSETVLNFQLTAPLTVTPGAVRNSDRPVLQDRTNGSESE
jgi:BON domain